MKVTLEIDSAKEALACTEAIYRWASKNDGRNLTAEIAAAAAKLLMLLEDHIEYTGEKCETCGWVGDPCSIHHALNERGEKR